MIKLEQVQAVVIFSDEPRALADWYAGVFEVREVYSSTGFIGLAAGRVNLFIQRTSEGHRPGIGGIRPHFTVADCRESFQQLVAAGASQILGVTNTGGELVAAVRDPEGNPIGLLQHLPR
jgi:predicted enzyme related to lactoylglutathione lyase